jgi:hypothetical protein
MDCMLCVLCSHASHQVSENRIALIQGTRADSLHAEQSSLAVKDIMRPCIACTRAITVSELHVLRGVRVCWAALR